MVRYGTVTVWYGMVRPFITYIRSENGNTAYWHTTVFATSPLQRYKHLFDVNEKKGSFYLQSKVYRARERLEEVRGCMRACMCVYVCVFEFWAII
jgi:hypothetical protein